MRPITTAETQFDYGPPKGMEQEVSTLPCARVKEYGATGIYSVWEPTESERKLIGLGHNVRLGIIGREPIPAVSLGVTHLYDIDDPA